MVYVNPMDIAQVLKDNKLSQNIARSIQNTDAIHKENAIQDIKTLKNAEISKYIIFQRITTIIVMMYAVDVFSLAQHGDMLNEYLNAIWPEKPEKAERDKRHLIIEMAVIKSQATPEAHDFIANIPTFNENI